MPTGSAAPASSVVWSRWISMNPARLRSQLGASGIRPGTSPGGRGGVLLGPGQPVDPVGPCADLAQTVQTCRQSPAVDHAVIMPDVAIESRSRPAFLFDLDGTLIDSVYQHVLAWREALAGVG